MRFDRGDRNPGWRYGECSIAMSGRNEPVTARMRCHHPMGSSGASIALPGTCRTRLRRYIQGACDWPIPSPGQAHSRRRSISSTRSWTDRMLQRVLHHLASRFAGPRIPNGFFLPRCGHLPRFNVAPRACAIPTANRWTSGRHAAALQAERSAAQAAGKGAY